MPIALKGSVLRYAAPNTAPTSVAAIWRQPDVNGLAACLLEHHDA